MSTILTSTLNSNREEPFRVRQRICALYLGLSGLFTSQTLRVLCKEHECFNSPNFSRNLKQDAEFFEGSSKTGWRLTEEGKVTATVFFGPAAVVEVVIEPESEEAVALEFEEAVIEAVAVAVEEIEEIEEELAVEEGESLPTILPTPVATRVIPMGHARAASSAMPPRLPRERGTDMLAALFRKIESDD